MSHTTAPHMCHANEPHKHRRMTHEAARTCRLCTGGCDAGSTDCMFSRRQTIHCITFYNSWRKQRHTSLMTNIRITSYKPQTTEY